MPETILSFWWQYSDVPFTLKAYWQTQIQQRNKPVKEVLHLLRMRRSASTTFIPIPLLLRCLFYPCQLYGLGERTYVCRVNAGGMDECRGEGTVAKGLGMSRGRFTSPERRVCNSIVGSFYCLLCLSPFTCVRVLIRIGLYVRIRVGICACVCVVVVNHPISWIFA